jgi:hypothetical protein
VYVMSQYNFWRENVTQIKEEENLNKLKKLHDSIFCFKSYRNLL